MEERKLLEEILSKLGRLEEQSAATLQKLEARIEALEAGAREEAVEPLSVELKSRALTLDAPENEGVILCLDFGTARSKAFGTASGVLLDLAIGDRAGQGGAAHSLLSCLFISDEGRIYFGELAAAKSEIPVSRNGRKRVDSIKGMITNSAPGSDLTQIRCDLAMNPTRNGLSEGDLLTLYLAYLTDMAALELSERHGLSRYVSRRFTTPVFGSEQRKWADETLRDHYCEAVLVADQFSGRWNDGIDANEALRVVRAARKHKSQLRYLTDIQVVEPVAAFSSRFRDFQPTAERRLLITVVDAGAGTTDFATFAVTQNPSSGLSMFTVMGSIHVFKKAGNEIDRILREHILDQVRTKHVGVDKDTMSRIEAQLSLDQRRIKEQLFRDERCEYLLADGTRGAVVLDEFLQLEAIEQFEGELRSEFEQSLKGMDSSWLRECGKYELHIVATGGSAELPMVSNLGKLMLNVNGVQTQCLRMPPIPSWVENDHPELRSQYAQLAVAIGGSQQVLPGNSEKQFEEFGGLGETGKWVIKPALKGS